MERFYVTGERPSGEIENERDVFTIVVDFSKGDAPEKVLVPAVVRAYRGVENLDQATVLAPDEEKTVFYGGCRALDRLYFDIGRGRRVNQVALVFLSDSPTVVALSDGNDAVTEAEEEDIVRSMIFQATMNTRPATKMANDVEEFINDAAKVRSRIERDEAALDTVLASAVERAGTPGTVEAEGMAGRYGVLSNTARELCETKSGERFRGISVDLAPTGLYAVHIHGVEYLGVANKELVDGAAGELASKFAASGVATVVLVVDAAKGDYKVVCLGRGPKAHMEVAYLSALSQAMWGRLPLKTRYGVAGELEMERHVRERVGV
jgi:hypothetical protein